MKKEKPIGIQFSIACLVIGTVLLIVNVIAFFNQKTFTAYLALTPLLLLSGIMFLVVPGKNPPPEVPSNERLRYWWKFSSTASKITWIITAVIGFGIGMRLSMYVIDRQY